MGDPSVQYLRNLCERFFSTESAEASSDVCGVGAMLVCCAVVSDFTLPLGRLLLREPPRDS